MKKILSLFMLVMCIAVGANAQISHTISNGVLTISGTGAMPDYSTSNKAPWSGKSFTSVVIKEGVTSIGKYAFYATGLADITIPSSVNAIGDRAFEKCTALKNVYWLGTSKVTMTVAKVFYGLSQGDINVYALSLDNVISGGWGFSVGMGQLACNGNEILWTLSKTGVLEVWSDGAVVDGNFKGASDLGLSVNTITLKDGLSDVTLVNDLLLSDNSTNVLLVPNKSTCVIPSTVERVGDYAFYGAYMMTNLVLYPVSGPTLGTSVFDDVTGLALEFKTIYNKEDAKTKYAEWFAKYDFDESKMIFGERPKSGTLESGFVWEVNNGKLEISGSGILSATEAEIMNWNALGVTAVAVGDAVTGISEHTFYNLGATSFTIPASVTSIGTNAFYGNGSATYNFNSNVALGTSGISEYATLNLVLADKVDLAKNVNTFDKVTLNRTFAAGATGTLILPFDAKAPSGFKLYTIDSYNNKVLTFAENGNYVVANTPYIYKNDGSSWTPTADDVTLGNFKDMYEYSADDWTMCGVYQSTTENNNASDEASTLWVYTTSAGKDGKGFGKFKNYAKSVTVSPYRVFFKGVPYNEVYNSSNTVNSYAPERSLSVEFVDLDGTTSITEIIIDKDGNITSAAEDGIYYDLSGRRVENPTSGIYIVNGKKVFVK